ncbi:IS21-like element helper ATPase IstB [Clostridium tertium]
MKNHDKKIFLNGIYEYANYLKLSTFKIGIDTEINSATEIDSSYEELIYKLLQKEYDYSQEEVRKSRVRIASFPYKKYLDELDINELPTDAQKKLGTLSTLDFIEKGQNVILSGNCGTGKTHMAIGLGIKACLSGYKVFFATVPLFITQLKELRSTKSLRSFQAKLEKYDLVILDEFGYISSDKEGAELLFTNLSIRTGRKSTIITTNLSFDRWGEVFTDPVMAAAMTDRITYKSYMVDMNGDSYRMKETKKWLTESKN